MALEKTRSTNKNQQKRELFGSSRIYIYIPLGYSQVAGCVSSGVSFDRCVSNLRLRALHLMIGQLVQYLNDLLPCARYIGLYWPLLVRGMINLKTWEVSLAVSRFLTCMLRNWYKIGYDCTLVSTPWSVHVHTYAMYMFI